MRRLKYLIYIRKPNPPPPSKKKTPTTFGLCNDFFQIDILCIIEMQIDSVFLIHCIVYRINTVNTQHEQIPDVLVQLGYIWRHVLDVDRPSSGQQGRVLLTYSQIVCPMGFHCLH